MLAAVEFADALRVVAGLLGGYLVGSIPMAGIIAGRHGVDLRRVGDRNPGYWNARQHLPRRAAVAVFIGDVAKGVVGAGWGRLLGGPWWVPWVAAAGAMAGHAWPLFAGRRGGRSVLTFVGAAGVVAPIPALLAAAICVVTTASTRRFAWGARIGFFGFPLVQACFDPRARVAATGALMSFIGLRFGRAAVAERAVAHASARPRHRRLGRTIDQASRATAAGSASGESQ